jgi:hypothetical protein
VEKPWWWLLGGCVGAILGEPEWALGCLCASRRHIFANSSSNGVGTALTWWHMYREHMYREGCGSVHGYLAAFKDGFMSLTPHSLPHYHILSLPHYLTHYLNTSCTHFHSHTFNHPFTQSITPSSTQTS